MALYFFALFFTLQLFCDMNYDRLPGGKLRILIVTKLPLL